MRSVRLDPELEARLAKAVKKTKRSASAIVREAVRRECDLILAETLYERLKDRIGVFDSRLSKPGKQNRDAYSRAFGEALETPGKRRSRRKAS